jgi:hypothetical protein
MAFNFSQNAHPTNSLFPRSEHSEHSSDFSHVNPQTTSNIGPLGALGNFRNPGPQVISLNEPKIPYKKLQWKYGGAVAQVHELMAMVADLLKDKNTIVDDKNQTVH